MDVIGLHVIVELSHCENIHAVDNEDALASLLLKCAVAANATVLSVKTHKFEPEGISGILFLAESHISAHVWPEAQYVSFDCYTCGHTTSPWTALKTFNKTVRPRYQSVTEVKRGLPNTRVDNTYQQEVTESGFHAVSLEEQN